MTNVKINIFLLKKLIMKIIYSKLNWDAPFKNLNYINSLKINVYSLKINVHRSCIYYAFQRLITNTKHEYMIIYTG